MTSATDVASTIERNVTSATDVTSMIWKERDVSHLRVINDRKNARRHPPRCRRRVKKQWHHPTTCYQPLLEEKRDVSHRRTTNQNETNATSSVAPGRGRRPCSETYCFSRTKTRAESYQAQCNIHLHKRKNQKGAPSKPLTHRTYNRFPV